MSLIRSRARTNESTYRGNVSLRQRRMVPIGGLHLAVILTLLFVATACPSQEPSEPRVNEKASAGDVERYTRRFFHGNPEPWRLESEAIQETFADRPMVIYEMNRFTPGTQATARQTKSARDLVERSKRAALKHGWEDVEQGIADGFVLQPGDRIHYFNEEYIRDDRVLDPDRPEYLMYFDTPNGKLLAGMMFYARSLEEHGPQYGGPLTLWHYHRWKYEVCLKDGLIPSGPRRYSEDDPPCPPGFQGSDKSPEMTHVWLIERPGGPFATSMFVPRRLVNKLSRERHRRLDQRPQSSSNQQDSADFPASDEAGTPPQVRIESAPSP